MDFSFLATVNASLNALSFVLLMFGYAAIKRGDKETHKKWMMSAGITTLVFLASYVTYHIMIKEVVHFKGQGTIRPFYFALLISHVILAATIAIMVPLTFRLALTEQWERHKRLAKITFPMWVYVSVTGVIIYAMVYHLYA